MIEIDRHRKAPVTCARIDVVAMFGKMPADLGVVAGHQITIHPRRPVLEKTLDGGNQAPYDTVAH